MQGRTVQDSSTEPDDLALPARWLPAFRRFVIIVVIIQIIAFFIAIPLEYQRRLESTTLQDVPERFETAGISPDLFVGYMVTITVLSGLVFSGLGILILFRRSNAFAPLFVGLMLITEGAQVGGLFYAFDDLGAAGRLFADITDAIGSVILVLFFLLFPSGRFVPAWTKWVAVAAVVTALLGFVFRIRDPLEQAPVATLVVLFSFFGLMIYAQIYRFRRQRTVTERQQIKWVMVGASTALVLFAVAAFATAANPDRGPVAVMFWYTLVSIGLLLIPITIAVAILRHRLLDIDYLINRTIVYSILTVLLGAVYGVSTLSLQLLFQSISGGSGITVALATLMVAGMFRPMRNRVQRSVDRRFYRTKYDATALLSRFSHSIRDEVDLDRVQQVMVATIDNAVRPSQMSVWLAEPGANPSRVSAQLRAPDDTPRPTTSETVT